MSAQVSVGVIDEAVYGVKPDDTPDPVSFFYRRNYADVSTSYSRNYAFTGYSGTQQLKLAQQRRRPMSLADFKAERPERPKVRKDFPDAIFWIADLVTDAKGTATVKVSYPDSLTTWRVTARAVTQDTRLGVGRLPHDDDEGRHRARRDAAVPHRGRHGQRAGGRAQLPAASRSRST